MSTSTKVKIAIAILAGIVVFAVSQAWPSTRHCFTDGQLYTLYKADNERYFGGKLPPTTAIEWSDYDPETVATTKCFQGSQNCIIKFNEEYATLQRFTHLILQHEMCHIETYDEMPEATDILGDDVDKDHGPRWRACMARIERDGAWRNILIDGYKGD